MGSLGGCFGVLSSSPRLMANGDWFLPSLSWTINILPHTHTHTHTHTHKIVRNVKSLYDKIQLTYSLWGVGWLCQFVLTNTHTYQIHRYTYVHTQIQSKGKGTGTDTGCVQVSKQNKLIRKEYELDIVNPNHVYLETSKSKTRNVHQTESVQENNRIIIHNYCYPQSYHRTA